MSSSEKNILERWNNECLWHPFTQMKEWNNEKISFIHKAKGSWLYDLEGKKYLDSIGSMWTNVHGHNHPKITKAIIDQAQKVSHTSLFGLSHPKASILAKRLVQRSPVHFKKVFYSDDGSTGVEVAIKMAYQYWQQMSSSSNKRKKIVKIKEAYHGDTLGCISAGAISLFHDMFQPLLFESYYVSSPFLFHSKFDKEEDLVEFCIQELKDLFEKKNEEIMALIIEPYVQGAASMIVFPNEYMKKVEKLCQEYNILLILDEVATGFGKTGNMFACEEENIKADIMVLSKGITGGYLPLAATLTSSKIYDAFLGDYSEFKHFFHGHTYSGNPLACAAAIASLDIFEEEEVLEKVQKKIKIFQDGLKNFWNLKHVGDIRQKGLMIAIELVEKRNPLIFYPIEKRIGHLVAKKARDHSIYTRSIGNSILCVPPLSISEEEIHFLLDGLYKSIQEITEEKKIL